MKSYKKLQELNDLLIHQVSQKDLINYCLNNQWIKKCKYQDVIVLDMNAILTDLIYGREQRLFNEFNYDYEDIKEDQLLEYLQIIVEQIQDVQTSIQVFNFSKLRTQKKDKEKPEKDLFKDNKEFDEIEKQYKKDFKEKDNKKIIYFMNKYQKFKKGLIDKKQFLEGMSLKDGIYYIENTKIPLFQQCQIEENGCEPVFFTDDGQEIKTDFQLQIMVTKTIFDYLLLLEDQLNNEMKQKFIDRVTNLCEEEVQEYINKQQYSGVDYLIRLTILSIYKNEFFEYEIIFDNDIYNQFLKITDEQTLKFRQENSSDINVDFSTIVDQWWDYLKDKGKVIQQVKQVDDQFDVYEIEDSEEFGEQKEIQLGD